MKKKNSILPALFIVLTVMGINRLSAQSFMDFDIDNKNKSVIIMGYHGKNLDITIPETMTIWKRPVTIIEKNAFKDKKLIGVIFPKTLVSIEDGAFDGNNLTEINIPEGVTSIGKSAFLNNKLNSVNLPKTLVAIGDGAFNANNLTEINIPEGVTSIGKIAFFRNKLNSVNLPKALVSIGDGAFSGNNLTEINIPQSVTFIGIGAFGNNPLSSLTVDPDNPVYSSKDLMLLSKDGKTLIQYYQDYRKNAGGTLVIPDGITTIEDFAFPTHKLKNISFPESVTIIGKMEFDRDSLINVTLPAGVTFKGKFRTMLDEDYEFAGKKAGTYMWKDNRWYCNGEALPAIVYLDNAYGVNIEKVDDKSMGNLIFLEGIHKIEVSYSSPMSGSKSMGSVVLSHNFEGGGNYFVGYSTQGNTVSFYIEKK